MLTEHYAGHNGDAELGSESMVVLARRWPGDRMRLLPATLMVVVVGGVAGCSTASSPTTQPAPITSRTEAAAAGNGAIELAATGEPLPPGRYTRSEFDPSLTFELDGAWKAVQIGDGFFDVQQDVGSPDVIAVQFAHPTQVFGAGGGVAPGSPAAAVELVNENPGLEVIEGSESRMGGLVGSLVTVENTGTGHAEVMEVPAGTIGIGPGRRLWMAFFDTADRLVVVMVGGSVQRWDAALLAAEPVLESVEFAG